ncbi:MAG: hypothetical protein Q4F72_11790, partial [Desulfovibrionaceae bacterium]|nr:hypothetical protein [Desulfovibrionaceae bacterium]
GEIGAHAFGGSGGLTEWDTHLYDMFGTKAALGMQPVLYELGGTYDSTVFVSGIGSTSGVTFRGDHVSEVLQGALGGGLPVNGFETGGGVSYAEFCHIELARSLMSHQNWRNWTFFMEAELAVLQDLGYQIDRKNWYGHSVYGDGLEITNTNGFWARNADGTAYVEGEANTATLGVGLHIYGSNNTVTQAADLMACGLAGTGIRVDGTGNTVTVAGGTTVAADGAWGTGLLVSYGQNQTVVSQGTLRAAGEGGIAARFDFGRNLMGEKSEYRGSWMRGGWNAESGSWQQVLLTDNDGLDSNDLPHWLDGAMVSRFAVSGSLEGSAAAVYISDNAYVKQMDILSGASLRGDIVSNWDPQSDRLQYAELTGESNTDLTTLVTFGRETLASGLGGEAGDAAFSLVYDGNITGAKSLELEVAGGGLEYNGKASVLSVTIEEGASLSGTGSYTLSTISDEDGANETGGTFANYGTFSPGSGPAAGDGSAAIAAVSIDGDYEQGANGTLVLSFDSSAASDTLTVSGTASLDGTVALAPVRDYYAGGEIGLVLSDMVDAATLELASDLDSILAAASPTLSMALTVESTGSDAEYSIGISRSADAYSRHAASGQQTDLARNLDEIGQADLSTASGDLSDARNLLTALDFSASDGSALPGAYNELGPDAYTKAGQASLALQRSLTAQIVNGRLFAPASDLKAQAGQSGQLAQAMAAGDESASAASAEAGSTRVFATPMGGRNV